MSMLSILNQTPPHEANNKSERHSKTVLDILATTGEEVPDMFTREAENPQMAADPSALSWMDCPVIDFSLLFSSTSSREEELKKLHSALLSWGSFQERTKYLRTEDDPEGYGNDTILSDKVPHNWNDRLYLNVSPQHQRKLNFWPQTPSSFRDILHEYTMKLHEVNKGLVQSMGRSLGLEENSFMDEYGENVTMATRINYYPQCPSPEMVRAARAHSDASALTILLQDQEVDGLQVLKDDMWFKVPIIPHALFVNVGDQMEIMSNGIYKSAVHRVVANSGRERMSIAMFCSPAPDKEVGPLKCLVSEDQPALYKTIKTYADIFFRYHPYGIRPITTVKI